MEPRTNPPMPERRVRVIFQWRVLALLLFLALNSVAAADDFSGPPPRMLELLRREHHPRHWLIVTTTSARLDLTVGSIANEGLSDLRALTPAQVPVPNSIPWSSIARIERLESRHRKARSTGVVLGGLAGGFAGAALGRLVSTLDRSTDRTYTDFGAFVGTAAGAVAGGWSGGKLGDRSAIRRPLYVARLEDRSNLRPAGPSDLVDPSNRDPSDRVVAHLGRSASKLSLRNIVRVRGSFGEVAGRVSRMDPDGHITLDRIPELDSTLPLPAEPIAWDAISRIERRGSSWRHHALVGGIMTSLAFGTMSEFDNSVSIRLHGTRRRDGGDAFAQGALAGALTGAGIGAVLGVMVPHWHRVVDRPLAATASAELTDP